MRILCGILEYEEFFVRVKTFVGNVIINGFNMKLTQLNSEDIMVKGIISSISFEKGEV
ncbi:MAG: YabP/YqfC family sporulation protein [Clostridia bacterium]|nr:YabP/YqfC family sporulation protein [Clostridia bacterium]